MHCPSTGPERSLLVHPSQSHLSPRTSYRLAAAAKTQGDRGETEGGKTRLKKSLHRMRKIKTNPSEQRSFSLINLKNVLFAACVY